MLPMFNASSLAATSGDFEDEPTEEIPLEELDEEQDQTSKCEQGLFHGSRCVVGAGEPCTMKS